MRQGAAGGWGFGWGGRDRGSTPNGHPVDGWHFSSHPFGQQRVHLLVFYLTTCVPFQGAQEVAEEDAVCAGGRAGAGPHPSPGGSRSLVASLQLASLKCALLGIIVFPTFVRIKWAETLLG